MTTLNRDRVVAAGLDLVDREGLAGFNLRRLAKELGVTPMALYNHISNKEDLVAAMAAYAVGGLEERLDSTQDWPALLEQAMRELYDALDRHPGVIDLIVARAEGERLSELREALMAPLVASGIDETADLLRTLVSYVVGFIVLARSRASVKVRRGSPHAFEYGLNLMITAISEQAWP